MPPVGLTGKGRQGQTSHEHRLARLLIPPHHPAGHRTDTICKTEGTTVIFAVRNTFAINSINRHCLDEVRTAVCVFLGDGASHQIMTRVQWEQTVQTKERSRKMREDHDAAERAWKQKELVTH